MVLWNQFRYGCCNKATIMIVTGTIKAFLQEIGITDITAKNIPRGIPRYGNIVTAERDLVADCMTKVFVEMIKDREKTHLYNHRLRTPYRAKSFCEAYRAVWKECIRETHTQASLC